MHKQDIIDIYFHSDICGVCVCVSDSFIDQFFNALHKAEKQKFVFPTVNVIVV